MTNNPTFNRDSCRKKISEQQAIKDSLAPFAPYPEARSQTSKSETRENTLASAK